MLLTGFSDPNTLHFLAAMVFLDLSSIFLFIAGLGGEGDIASPHFANEKAESGRLPKITVRFQGSVGRAGQMATLAGERSCVISGTLKHLHSASLYSGSWDGYRSPSFFCPESHRYFVLWKRNCTFPLRSLHFRSKRNDLLVWVANVPKGKHFPGKKLTSLTVLTASKQSPVPLPQASMSLTEGAGEKNGG